MEVVHVRRGVVCHPRPAPWLLAPATAPAQPCTGTADVTLGLLMPDDVVTCQGGKVSFCITRPAFPAPAPYDQVPIDPAGLDSFDPDDPPPSPTRTRSRSSTGPPPVRALQINTPVATVNAGFKRGQYNPTGCPPLERSRAHRGDRCGEPFRGVRRPGDMIGEDSSTSTIAPTASNSSFRKATSSGQILHDPEADIPIYAW
jgi:hypothetical protein